jgi:hypothetical protein
MQGIGECIGQTLTRTVCDANVRFMMRLLLTQQSHPGSLPTPWYYKPHLATSNIVAVGYNTDVGPKGSHGTLNLCRGRQLELMELGMSSPDARDKVIADEMTRRGEGCATLPGSPPH